MSNMNNNLFWGQRHSDKELPPLQAANNQFQQQAKVVDSEIRAAVLAATSLPTLPPYSGQNSNSSPNNIGIAVNSSKENGTSTSSNNNNINKSNQQIPSHSQQQLQPLHLPNPISSSNNTSQNPDNWSYGQFQNPSHQQLNGQVQLPHLAPYNDPKDSSNSSNNSNNSNVMNVLNSMPDSTASNGNSNNGVISSSGQGMNNPEDDDGAYASVPPTGINGVKVLPELTPAVDAKGRPVVYHGKPLTNTKRAAQNRAAQRAFRFRKELHIKELEAKIEENRVMEQTVASLRSEVSDLKNLISTLEARLAVYENGKGSN